MALTTLRRRLRLALRQPSEPAPLTALLTLLRAGGDEGPAHLDLYVALGMRQRAHDALRRQPTLVPRPSTQVRLALLNGDLDHALAMARALPAGDESVAEARIIVDAMTAVSASACLEIIRRFHLPHPAEPALLAHTGQLDAARTRAADLGHTLGPDGWLLAANLDNLSDGPLHGLNRYLDEHRLTAVAAVDPGRELSVNNLRPATSRPVSTSKLRLSVVMTAHQSAAHIGAAIRSVLHSTHAALELIAVDDGSTDDTWSHICALARNDARIRPVRIGRNVGTYAAKNVGLELATGDFAAFQDADDWSHPDRFMLCIAALQQNTERVAVTCRYLRLDDEGCFRSAKLWPLTRWTPNSLVFRRAEVLERIGFFDEHRFGADSEYVARLKAAFEPRAHHKLMLPLIVAAHRPNSLMTSNATGLDAQGLSRDRVDFQEAWTEKLLQRLLTGKSLRRDALVGTRMHLGTQLQFA
jgi:hypothetical protein